MSRLSRRDMKRDEVLEGFGAAVHYARSHLGILLWIGLALVAAALLVAGGYALWTQREERSADLLAQAARALEAPVGVDAPDPDDPWAPSFPDEEARRAHADALLRRLSEGYGRTDAGRIADLYLADLAAASGDPERARELWSRFLARSGDHALAAQARLNLVVLDREQGRGEELAAELRGLLESTEKRLPDDVILRELAVTLAQLGRGEEARETYQRLLDEHPQSPWAPEARQALAGAA